LLKIWGRKNAYNVQKVLWFLDELEILFEHVDIGSIPGDLDSKEFLTKNPNGRIPVILDNGTYIWESNTILRYLAATYGKDSYWIDNPESRTYVDRWLDWELASLQPDYISLFWEYYRTPEVQRDNDKIDYSLCRCKRNLSILNHQLENTLYVAGSEFSLADIAVGTCFYRYFNMGIKTPTFPNVDKWYKKLSNRAAYQKNIAVPFNELKGRLEF